VLWFQSEPLDEPLPIVGRLQAELYIQSDAPDTLFVVKIVDVYPDGYMAIFRESAAMARFGDNLATASPLTRGAVRKLTVDLWSTAYVINRGHRLGVIITSASDPAYEVHPNTYEPVMDASGFKTANNQIHWSAQYPSHITLPLAPEVLAQ
jgi:putative CocE/NonD family hydrolase